jgi:hypothetical protein
VWIRATIANEAAGVAYGASGPYYVHDEGQNSLQPQPRGSHGNGHTSTVIELDSLQTPPSRSLGDSFRCPLSFILFAGSDLLSSPSLMVHPRAAVDTHLAAVRCAATHAATKSPIIVQLSLSSDADSSNHLHRPSRTEFASRRYGHVTACRFSLYGPQQQLISPRTLRWPPARTRRRMSSAGTRRCRGAIPPVP